MGGIILRCKTETSLPSSACLVNRFLKICKSCTVAPTNLRGLRARVSGSKTFLGLLVVNGVGVDTSSLGDEEVCDDGTGKLEGEKDPEHTRQADSAMVDVGTRLGLRPPVEPNTGEDGTELADGSAKAMSQTTNARREYLTRDDESSRVRPEVHEQLRNSEKRETRSGAQGGVGSGKNTEHEGGDEETLDLNPFATENLDEGDGEEVTRNVSGNCDNQVALCTSEEEVVW